MKENLHFVRSFQRTQIRCPIKQHTECALSVRLQLVANFILCRRMNINRANWAASGAGDLTVCGVLRPINEREMQMQAAVGQSGAPRLGMYREDADTASGWQAAWLAGCLPVSPAGSHFIDHNRQSLPPGQSGNTRRLPNVGLMLGQRCRCWTNIKPTFGAHRANSLLPSTHTLLLSKQRHSKFQT